MSKSVLAECIGWRSRHPHLMQKMLGKAARAVINPNPLTRAAGRIMYHSGACFEIVNWISHFITYKKSCICCSPKLPTLQALCRWGIKVERSICVLLIKQVKSLAPPQVKFNAAYRNKSHVPKISIFGISAESSCPKLCQKLIQERLLHVPIATVQCDCSHFKYHVAHLNLINCNNYYSTTAKGILQQNQDVSSRITCRPSCQCNK